MPSKIETIVFAENAELAQSLVEKLFDRYPAVLSGFSTVGGTERDLKIIYEARPELIGIDPKRGYIYNESFLRNGIYRYFNK